MRARLLPSPRLPLAAALALAIAACVGAPPPPAAPPPRAVSVPRPAPPPPPPKALGADWRDWPLTPGTWSYRRDERGSLALFGVAGSDALLTLRCDAAAHRLYLSRAGTAATPATVRTSTAVRALPMQPTGGATPYVATALAPSDPLLDAIGFSRGHFLVEQAGQPPLVVPAWAEVERVTQDCRN